MRRCTTEDELLEIRHALAYPLHIPARLGGAVRLDDKRAVDEFDDLRFGVGV